MNDHSDFDTDPGRHRARRFLLAFALLLTLWWVLSGDLSSWRFGVPAALAAALVFTLLPATASWRLRPIGALRFAAWYLVESIRGGIDVALRALRPSLPLAPGFVDYRTRLPRGPARTCFVAVIGLLPGTLTAKIAGDRLTIHVLDTGLPVERSLERLEDRIAAMFTRDGDAGDAPS